MSRTSHARAARLLGRTTNMMRQSYKYRMKNGETLLCGICGERIYYPLPKSQTIKRGGKGAVSVDHIIPLAAGGLDHVSNMQPAHTLCNQLKGDKVEVTL